MFLDYLKTNYGMGLAARALKSIGAIEFATTLAPGLKDILITGKIMECTQRRASDGRYTYDAIVVDAPPGTPTTASPEPTVRIQTLPPTGRGWRRSSHT